MATLEDLTGKKFNRLTPIKYLHWKDAVTLFETPVKVGNNQTLRGDRN